MFQGRPDISPSAAYASESPGWGRGVFTKMQILGSHARSGESESLEEGPGMYNFDKLILNSLYFTVYPEVQF